MSKEQILKEFEDKYSSFELCNQVSKPELDKLKDFISKAIDQTIEETIMEEISYWTDVFDNRPKNRDLESDNIAQNFARIEIER